MPTLDETRTADATELQNLLTGDVEYDDGYIQGTELKEALHTFESVLDS